MLDPIDEIRLLEFPVRAFNILCPVAQEVSGNQITLDWYAKKNIRAEKLAREVESLRREFLVNL